MHSTPSLALPRPPQRLDAGLAPWIGFAAVLLAAPLLWHSDFAQSLLSQIGIAVVACLAYNILLGQGGMLSFGHAVYSGLGAYLSIHTLNLVSAGGLALPVSLIPLVGGAAGLGVAALFGYVTTKKAGTTFAMITLGIGELVWSMSLMLPEFFGGEAGVAGNRVAGLTTLGISFGPQIQVYYLIAAYCFVCTAAMFAFTRTPLGRLLNAVRDNPERVQFIGYSTRHVRYIAFMISGFFAGIAGGLSTLNFEIVTAEMVSAARSGTYLLFVFVGGTAHFFGPIIGAVLMVLSLVLLSELTPAWSLYLGVAFVLMVMHAPGGIAGLAAALARVLRYRRLAQMRLAYLGMVASLLLTLAGTSALVEMTYHLRQHGAESPPLHHLGLTLDAQGMPAWLGAGLAAVLGLWCLSHARRRFRREWNEVQLQIESELVNEEER
ncbi:branched-chain amino acid ABC transporter permease [Schlegelella sp. S2-27]|uniref:Branched-chain amino acid ABC transporter permease n=1 Tax=Caldimonas mangrovi TaxID=2944811 RepID=A0ABT0YHT7_9BURK|nr:branched-chain amino acid ABC transporter permease [Caldimonas mangrovi]MCM5678282.1 branched-chain amino acid ABC transporter permease [Caldimonas mangrovi]